MSGSRQDLHQRHTAHVVHGSAVFTRDSMLARICYRPSVCPSVHHTGGSVENAFEVRIVQFLPYVSPIPLVFAG